MLHEQTAKYTPSEVNEKTVVPGDKLSLGMQATLFLASTATLLFEITLTRLFSVAQFYHFAFMIVSIALLGFGASGTLLALFPSRVQANPRRSLGWCAVTTGASIMVAYLLTNWLPFDSFSIAWDWRQSLILILHYLALATPFFCNGLAVGMLLSVYPKIAGRVYALNLFGSALGCLVALLAPAHLGGEGAVGLSISLAGWGSLSSYAGSGAPKRRVEAGMFAVLCVGILSVSMIDMAGRLLVGDGLGILALKISPYKGLSYALQYPGAQVSYQRWNAYSRVDLVRSPGVRSVPGLSYRFLQPLPPEDGLYIDADDLSPVISAHSGLDFAAFLPAYWIYQIRPAAETLVLEPGGGLDILIAIAGGVRQLTAVQVNPLIVDVAASLYRAPGVQVVPEGMRSFLRRSFADYDVIVLSLATSYHPVRSGAYSLVEDYRFTQEAFHDMFSRLREDGVLVFSRWLQPIPSECLRAFALAVTALERAGLDPRQHLVVLRGYNLATFFVKRTPWTAAELTSLRDFAAGRAFDLVIAPDLRLEETNRYNILPEPVYYQAFNGLLLAANREAFYKSYPFDIRPPTDNHPFFGHFFKWSQASQVLAELGKTWQPFGGAGYFVVLILLALAMLAAVVVILLPVVVARWRRARSRQVRDNRKHNRAGVVGYFALIGLAYLLVEIPLIQQFILYLGHPAYALTTVLFSLLLFSGVGSRLSERLPLHLVLPGLVLILVASPWILPLCFRFSLGLPIVLRLMIAVALLAPLGFLMWIPLPACVMHLDQRADRVTMIPWAWGVNGATSVVAAVLAAFLSLTWGFMLVLYVGALCYGLAAVKVLLERLSLQHLPR